MIFYLKHLITIIYKVRIIAFIVLGYFVLSNSIIAQSGNAVIDSLNSLLPSIRTDTTRIIVLNKLAWAYIKIDKDSSILYANMALNENDGSHPKGLIKTYNTLGAIEYYKSKFYSAISYYRKSLEIAYQIDSKKAIASTANNIGIMYKKLGNYIKSIEYNQKSLQIKEELDDKKGIIISLLNIANLFYELNKIEDALNYNEQALTLAKIYSPERIPGLLNTMGVLYNEIEEYSKSLEYLNNALKINIKDNNDNRIVMNFQNIANTYTAMGKYDMAMLKYMEALEIKIIIGNKWSIAKTNMAIGILAYEMNDYHKSISFLKTAENFFLESDNIFELKPIYLFMAKSYYKLNLSKEAYSSLLSSYELSDSLYTIESAKIIEELEIKYQTEKKEQEIVSLTKEKALELAQSKNKTYFILILVLVIFIAGITIYFYFKNQKNRHLRKITMERALEAESQKRRFAKELHDGTGSNLTGIRLQLLALKDNSMVDNVTIGEVIMEVERTHQGVRLLAYQASPPEFDNYTLDEAISDLVRRLTKTGAIEINYNSTVTFNWLQISNDFQLAVYRIIQEALSNIIKHSGANNVDIQIIQHEDTINVMIEDDGKGFDVTIVNKGLGLKNMEDRALSINAKINIDSTLHKGTSIIIEIPIPKNI